MRQYSLYKHQIEGIELGVNGPRCYFWSCGTGKTCLMINIIDRLRKSGIGPALIVAPLSILETAWIEDVKKFAPHLSIINLHSAKDRSKALAQDYDIYIINFEAFKLLFTQIAAKHFQVLVVDESSKMKDPASQTTRALLALSGLTCRAKSGIKYHSPWIVPFRYALSGTPAPNSQVEFWSQVVFVTGPGNKVFSDNFYSFRGQYCYSIPISATQKKWVFRKSMQNELMQKIKPVAHVVRKEDAVDLPSQLHTIRKVYLGREEQKAYNQLRDELVLQFGNETVLASTALTEIMKLRQLTSGFIYSDNAVFQFGKSKLLELKGLLEEIGNEQIIVWCNFRSEIALLLAELPGSRAIYSQTADRNETIRDFQGGKFQYLIANPASCAHGITFTNSCYNIYYSLNYSYELHEQSLNRTHRIGQSRPVTYYYLLADRTIDEVVFRALQNKQTVSDGVLKYLKEARRGA